MADHKCYRCHKNVYPVDKIGPLKDLSFFHKHCFKCYVCGIHLTLKTYFNNNLMQEDKEVYCTNHVPKATAGSFDGQAVGIRAALNVPKVSSINEQIRGAGEKGTFDVHALGIRTSLSPAKAEERRESNSSNFKITGRFDAGALHIAHAIHAQELQKGYPKQTYNAPLYYLDLDTQTELEMKHRTEEDDLYRRFQRHREQEEKSIYQEIQNEWDRALDTLTAKFNHELQIKKKKITVEDQKTLTLKLQREKEELEKVMTLKRDKKKESLTKKLLERERSETAELVDRHSREMLTLINQKKIEYSEGLNDDNKDITPYPVNPPPPTPPPYSKAQIYSDPLVFKELDQIAINVAQEDQKTFTDLVRMLIHNCRSDVEKARAIFRWITVKDLNRMEFDDSVKADTPMGLLRGIKYGTESYHVLFKRLCSYAGLHCIVIKGYSKSAGYQPGIKFEDNRFRNSWNAVYVENSWRFVQCNWGARHLVNAKETPKPGARNKSDSLRYEYDDHYFLTDPEEFIYEFFPLPKEWQLLRKPIILEEFEDLPFVRSLFFRYGLWFPDASSRAIVNTDNTGAATVRINMPAEMAVRLIFHYNLKFYDDDLDLYENTSLKRFVLQSVSGNSVIFRVHAPCSGTFLLDIFANAVTPREYLTGEPMKFKSVCKFKIVCKNLQTVMVPLPDCASGEWGPMKGSRLFGLIPISHEEALIFSSRDLEIQFRTTRPLSEFMASLHKNNFEEKRLSKYIKHSRNGDIVSFFISFPEDGQYGLDIYTRETLNHEVERAGDKHLLTHCCKYLINVTKKSAFI